MEAGAKFVSPTGYVDIDNDCEYSIDLKSTRSREHVSPKEDLAFYFDNYLAPKYGLSNINVSNTASFMKELEMNWSKLTPELKDKVLDIMVDNILAENYDFKNSLLTKLGVQQQNNPSPVNNVPFSKSTFGADSLDYTYIAIGLVFIAFVFFLIQKIKVKPDGFPKMT
jgi:hypothetical protein